MIVYCCSKCKMVDIGEENEQKNCMRCGIPMLSLGLSSSEWNKLNSEQMKEAVNACIGEQAPAEETLIQPERAEFEPAEEYNTEPVEQYEDEEPSAEEITDDFAPPVEDYSSRETTSDIKDSTKESVASKKKVVGSAPSDSVAATKQVSRAKRADVSSNIPQGSTVNNNGRFTKLSIAALVCSIIGCISVVGIILGIVDLIQGSQTNDGRKKGLSIAAIAVGVAFILIGFVSIVATSGSRYVDKVRSEREVVEEVTHTPTETPTPTPTETPTPTPNPEPTEEPQEEKSEGNGVDASEWPEVASLEMSNEEMLKLYNDYYAKIYSDEYPEDDVDAMDAYEEKVGKEIAEKYEMTPEQARLVYAYVSMNYDKVANNGSEVNKEPKLSYGELKSVVTNGGIAVISAKVDSQLSNKMTIEQNYINVDDLIKKEGYDVFDEIQYYAFADTVDGDQVKIISFTVPKATIQMCANKTIMGVMLEDYVDDLWIMPSLKK